MGIRTSSIGGSIPQINRGPLSAGIRPLFHSVRDIALILDKTVKPGYGFLKAGTVMAECAAKKMLVPYPVANANENPTNAKAYLVASAASAATSVYVGIEDSYKFQIGDSLIIDGSGAGVAEIQSIVCETPWATGSVYTITHGSTVLAATQGATQTLAGIVAVFQALPGYAAAPFTITAGSDALTLTWKTIGVVSTLASMVKDAGEAVAATRTTTGVDYQQGALSAEDLGAITAIDRTAVNGTQAKITFTTAITTYANFSTTYFANVYVKGGDAATPFTKAECILDADIDTGTGENAVGALTSVVLSNAVLYTASLIGLDAAAITDLGAVTNGRFTILK